MTIRLYVAAGESILVRGMETWTIDRVIEKMALESYNINR